MVVLTVFYAGGNISRHIMNSINRDLVKFLDKVIITYDMISMIH